MNRSRPIERIAIVNRGEAAMRCIRSVKALRAEEGSPLQVIALYTPVDRDAPFVRYADCAVELETSNGEVAAYLDHDGVLAALRASRADAVWPGWGFLAEDPAFVERINGEGLRFLGPSAEAMRRLGDKISAKRIAELAGIPVTPWNGAALENEEEARAQAAGLGYPVVLKASAGGGGRGIRVVEDPDCMSEAFRSASSEAAAAFGDQRLFLERRVSGGRHVEVQIAADVHGNVHALGCRDCSVQRRHQKLIEETPPFGIDAARLAHLREASVRMAKAVDYHGVGTVEFLVAGAEFHFLEMNPRLQVEHGITEEVTGLDLVRLQIRIARGESLADLVFEERGAAIEARICAEDPDAGHLPAPGRIARFDSSVGPRIRIDSGVSTGSEVPAVFDSLIAKVIASGDDREEARARLHCALTDFDLVLAGGATNKGFLLDVLEAPDYRAGRIDTTWLDRFESDRGDRTEFAVEALAAAAILAYQSARRAQRMNFYADTANIAVSRIPASLGQEIDLATGGEQYRFRVYAVGSWRYRIHLDGRVLAATLREEGAHTARLQIGERTLRVLYDMTDSDLRVEVEGRAHRFRRQAAGMVRASTPAMVVAIHAGPGDRVEAGQRLGVLEAMKVEVAFEAPVTGIVQEVRARRGQQVAAGDILLVIDPAADTPAQDGGADRLELFEIPDPLDPLFAATPGDEPAAPNLAVAEHLDDGVRRLALGAVRDEVRRVLLGYDGNSERTELLASFLNAPIPDDLTEPLLWELAEIRNELGAFADVEQLFIRAPRASVGGEPGPSNSARLRMFVRRIRAGGAGVAPEFLTLVRRAMAHYGVPSLEYGDALERAVLRLLATRHSIEMRRRLVHGVLRRVTELARRGVHLGDDSHLEDAISRIAGMRGLVSDAVADTAADAGYEIFERPRIERSAERTSKQLGVWLAAAQSEPTEPPEDVLIHLADAPSQVFDRVGCWLADGDPRRRAIALAAHLRRLYSPRVPVRHSSALRGEGWFDRTDFADLGTVLATTCSADELVERATRLCERAVRKGESGDWPAVGAVEIFVPLEDTSGFDALAKRLAGLPVGPAAGFRLSLTGLAPDSEPRHQTLVPSPDRLAPERGFNGIHPETARRIDLERLVNFELERISAAEGIYCFHARSRQVPADERIFVLADARSRSPEDGREVALHVAAFEHSFHEATRALRTILRARDTNRRLQWNRIALFVSPEIFLDPEIAQHIARRLAPATRNLGLEKVVVRLRLLDRNDPQRAAREVEFVISDITGSSMEIQQREPHTRPLEPRTDYERKVVEARRRRLVYPYEIIRMLTGSGRSPASATVEGGWSLPIGSFEEYDLDPDSSECVAKKVAGRPFGLNQTSIVFGVIDTPTEKVPEGMRRVLVLSDPTIGMGSLGAPECDRIVAALDLAEKLAVPLEWIPVSSGARIAMDSGTENLDATARVVRRIVQFTQAGGPIHIIVHGVNVGAQSYFDALATMSSHTRGALIMTPRASMVLTGRAALEASGAVSAEDEIAIGGFERIMGPNGEAQYFARDVVDAYRILYEHYGFTYVVPGESTPRTLETSDPLSRSIRDFPCRAERSEGFATVGEIFDAETNPGRKRPFPMRAVMNSVIDRDGGHLERWRSMAGAETAIVWDAHIGGMPVCLIGIESRNLAREGYHPSDGPEEWNAATLFPLSSKKVARAINAASGNRPVVVLANLSGFDGSPESMRKLQLEYGAEIARAVVNFDGPIVFLVVSRYHGGAYVVFSQELNPQLRASALEGSFASVIGGGPAAAVVFTREVRARALADPRVIEVDKALRGSPSAAARERFERTLSEVMLEQQAETAEKFDAVHSVERAYRVGSLSEIVDPANMRAFLSSEVRRRGPTGQEG